MVTEFHFGTCNLIEEDKSMDLVPQNKSNKIGFTYCLRSAVGHGPLPVSSRLTCLKTKISRRSECGSQKPISVQS